MSAESVTYRGCKALVETENALKVAVPVKGNMVPIWIPKAQIDDDSEVFKMGTEGRLVIPLWLAEAKGLPV